MNECVADSIAALDRLRAALTLTSAMQDAAGQHVDDLSAVAAASPPAPPHAAARDGRAHAADGERPTGGADPDRLQLLDTRVHVLRQLVDRLARVSAVGAAPAELPDDDAAGRAGLYAQQPAGSFAHGARVAANRVPAHGTLPYPPAGAALQTPVLRTRPAQQSQPQLQLQPQAQVHVQAATHAPVFAPAYEAERGLTRASTAPVIDHYAGQYARQPGGVLHFRSVPHGAAAAAASAQQQAQQRAGLMAPWQPHRASRSRFLEAFVDAPSAYDMGHVPQVPPSSKNWRRGH